MAIKSDFIPSGTYEVSELNQLTGCFIKSGVIGIDDLKVVCKNGSAVVGEGRCILPDKSIMTVESGGYSIPVQLYDGYIYIENGEIKYGAEAGEDSFLLAQLTQGQCTDLRSRAYIYSGEGVN